MLAGGFIKVKLAHVKKERKPERYAYQKTGNNGKPEMSHTEATAFCKNENKARARRQSIKPSKHNAAIAKKTQPSKKKTSGTWPAAAGKLKRGLLSLHAS